MEVVARDAKLMHVVAPKEASTCRSEGYVIACHSLR